MVLNWCYDEPWPSAANNSLVVWPAVPKPALKEVREACRPICASARFDRFDHVPGENLDIGLWVLNDSPEPFRESLRIKARLLPGNPSDGEGVEAGEWTSGPLKPGTNAQGPVLSVRIPEGWTGRIFRVILDVPSHPGLSASYTLALRKGPATES
jgi:beta-mannosidase